MEIQHILLRTEYLVVPILNNLKTGADFAQLAREHSACPSALQGGSLGRIEIEDLPASIREALADAPLGEVIGPIETHHGLHIVRRNG